MFRVFNDNAEFFRGNEKKNGGSCSQLSVIIFHLKLINERHFHFGLRTAFLLYRWWTYTTLLQSTTRGHQRKSPKRFLFWDKREDCDYIHFNIIQYLYHAFGWFIVVFVTLFRLLWLSFQFAREISQTQKLGGNNLWLGNYTISLCQSDAIFFFFL